MTGGHDVNCIVFKSLIPFIEQEAGPAAAQALVAAAGKPREWLIADHNWVSLATCDRLVHLAMKLMGATDVEAWTRRWTDYHMDWKPSHDERSYIGTYTMGLGSPQALFERIAAVHGALYRFYTMETVEIRRGWATLRVTPTRAFRARRSSRSMRRPARSARSR